MIDKEILTGRISKTEAVHYAKELHNDETGISEFCNIMLNSENKRASYNAAWILFHLSKEDKSIYLMPSYNIIVDMAISANVSNSRRLILSIIADMPITDNYRTDLLDFCINNMINRNESDSSRSVMIKLAAKMCKPFPELRNELAASLEVLSDDMKPSISAASKNALKAIR